MKQEYIEKIKEKANYCLHCKTKPCTKGCPLENDIPEFIQAVKDEKYEEAFQILSQTTILMPICGRICPHKSQCEGSCVRGLKGKSVSIGDIEAFVGDMAFKENYEIEKENLNGKKVAIVGGGPAGIAAAYYLRKNGYMVTIFEKYSVLGGLLNHGIPEFRLDKELLNNWINKVLSLGIEVKYNSKLGKDITINGLKEQFDSVLLAIGANVSSKMNIPGEDLIGVYGGNELLEFKSHPDYNGKKVAVIGGGNVAMDAARTVNKMGAKEVTVIYRRSKEQMPAEEKEIADAENEGVNFLFKTNVKRILSNSGKVEKIECIKTNLVQKQGEERLVPVDIEKSEFLLDMDYVIMAVGSVPEKKLVDSLELETSKWGYINVNENYETSIENVYAAGDIIGAKQTVAWAARAGITAAKQIIKKDNEKCKM